MTNRPNLSTPDAQLQAEAVSENTLQERLRELVKICTELASVVASNVNTEPELLRELAASKDDATRQNVVSNPNTPTDVLWKLGEEFPLKLWENPVFSLLLLENPNLIEEIPYLLQVKSVPISLLEWGAQSTNLTNRSFM